MAVMEFRAEEHRDCGFSRAEAMIRKAVIDNQYEVSDPSSTWQPARVVRDKDKKSGGFKVVIESKE